MPDCRGAWLLGASAAFNVPALIPSLHQVDLYQHGKHRLKQWQWYTSTLEALTVQTDEKFEDAIGRIRHIEQGLRMVSRV
jgi:hypothetical protein